MESAATTHAVNRAREASTLGDLTALLESVRYADLPNALAPALTALDARAAVSADVAEMLAALPPLARLARYGDVRGRVTGDLKATGTFRALLTRASVGLPATATGLTEDAASELRTAVQEADAAVRLLDDPEALSEWYAALHELAAREDIPPLLAGDAVRRLRDGGELEASVVERHMQLALASAQPPQAVTAWLDGFLGQSGILLTHDRVLLSLLDGWLTTLDAEVFQEVLPLLRRVFSRFEKAERRAIGAALRTGGSAVQTAQYAFSEQRGLRVVPVVAMMLGVGS